MVTRNTSIVAVAPFDSLGIAKFEGHNEIAQYEGLRKPRTYFYPSRMDKRHPRVARRDEDVVDM